MKILNLYAGIGGNRKLWGDEHEITAVEYKPEIAKIYQDFFPNDTVIVADAHEYLLKHYAEFDFIWASPPCPSHSRARYGLGFHGKGYAAVYADMHLYQEILFLKHYFTGKWCVENVIAYYEPLIIPQTLGRHWYWTNFLFPFDFKIQPSRISQQSYKYSKNPVYAFNTKEFEETLGFDLSKHKVPGKRLMLRNCVEPEVGKHILHYALNPIKLQKELKF